MPIAAALPVEVPQADHPAADATLADALLAAKLLASDLRLGGRLGGRLSGRLGGIVLRGDGPARDAVLAALGPMRRLPVTIDDDALLGGRELTATLGGGGSAVRPGLLAQGDGALLVVRGAERMSDATAARLSSVLDDGVVRVERDGIAVEHSTRFGLVLLDDGRGDGERVPDRLRERLAFSFDLTDVVPGDRGMPEGAGRPTLPNAIGSSDEAIRSIAQACAVLGIESPRAAQLALRVARLTDWPTAVRLVLAHRATRLPAPPDESVPPSPPQGAPREGESQPLDDVVLDAVTAALPADVLAALAAGSGRKPPRTTGQGERRRSPLRGRPLGSRAGAPRGGARLALIDTLRAAAPWQRLRGRGDAPNARIVVGREDVRIKRFETRTDSTTIFAVDASGSAAAARLGEAKGAVELLLAQAYVKRTEVALIAFRGLTADLVLPPTRSLTRARRALGDLPGGGATPLAAGITAASALAALVRGKGRTPFVVVLSDGRGNVAADGSNDAAAARTDAERAGAALSATGTAAVFIDISPRPRAEAGTLAHIMGARYLPLPRADAQVLADAVTRAQADSG